MTTYVSYFDKSYFPRGVALIDSLLAVAPDSRVVIWALDVETKLGLGALYNNNVIALDFDFVDQRWPKLSKPPTERNYLESLSMRRPALLLSLMQEMMAPDELVFYVDSDCLFFSSPKPLLDMMENASIGVSPHGFSQRHDWLVMNGVYNAGLMIIRNDAQGRACMRDWLDDCFQWCHYPAEDNKLLNQGYLTFWPSRYERVTSLDHPGVNLAPWNYEGRRLSITGNTICINEAPLIVYHFHGMKRRESAWENVSSLVDRDLHRELFEHIYDPYIAQLTHGEERLINLGFDVAMPTFQKYPKKA
ncbi:MAG: putative nucleotide-diphospho-sugar transferase [Lysobacterales bacterium]